jgi:hypothetical protein
MKNEIMLEVWHNRDEFAKDHNYNLDAMAAALQEMEKHPLTQMVDRRIRATFKTAKSGPKLPRKK